MKTVIGIVVLVFGTLTACGEPVAPSGALPASLQGQVVWRLESALAFTTRDDPTGVPQLAAEIYLMDGNGANVRRLTANAFGEGFATLSPDGKKIAFDSNRRRVEGDPPNVSDLFVMNSDGSEQTWLTRGSSATWSPDGKNIAFHASASGTGLPIKPRLMDNGSCSRVTT